VQCVFVFVFPFDFSEPASTLLFSPLGLVWLCTTLFWDRSVHCRSQFLCTVLQDYKNTIQNLPFCNYVLQNALHFSVLKLFSLFPSRSTAGGWAPSNHPDWAEGRIAEEPDVLIRMVGGRPL